MIQHFKNNCIIKNKVCFCWHYRRKFSPAGVIILLSHQTFNHLQKLLMKPSPVGQSLWGWGGIGGENVNTDVQIRVWMIHSAEISLRLQQQLSQDSGTLCLSVQHTGLSSEIDFPPERQIESHMKYNRKNKKVPVSTSCLPPCLIPSTPLTSSRALVPFCPSPSSLVSKWSGVFKPKLRSAARYTVPIATSQTVLWLHYNPTVIKSKWNRDDKDAIFSQCLCERVCALPFHFVLFHFLLPSNQLSLAAAFFITLGHCFGQT